MTGSSTAPSRAGRTAAPKIAVVLDENTSGDATRYEAPKSLFRSLEEAGGYVHGIPYSPGWTDTLIADFNGLVCPGGRFAFSSDWYEEVTTMAPPSERCQFELGLMQGFLEAGKPVLGICSGMQMLAGLLGAKLSGDITRSNPDALPHNGEDIHHRVSVAAGTQLAALTGASDFEVNSLHNEAVVVTGPEIVASAFAPDGTIEAVEAPAYKFALGVQWHQERYQGKSHPGNAIFSAFLNAT